MNPQRTPGRQTGRIAAAVGVWIVAGIAYLSFPRIKAIANASRSTRRRAGRIAVAVLAFLSAGIAAAQSPEIKAIANADRQRFPQEEWGYIYYLSSDHLPDEEAAELQTTAAFVMASFSKSVVLEDQIPVEVVPGLRRFDLRGLGWKWQDWHAALKTYPYAPTVDYPLVVRADWLTLNLADQKQSQAGYLLLYGSKGVPKNLDDFKRFWGVGISKRELALFHIQQDSEVSLLDIRFIEQADGKDRVTYYGTQDNKKENFNANTDPLETLNDAKRNHDASEHIVQFPKVSVSQGAGGSAQQYLLANGQGVRQDFAPVDIVEDNNRLRGVAEIRNFSSCVVCHPRGIIALGKNDLRDLIEKGVELYADKKSQRFIEQTALAETRLKVEVARHQEDYTAFIALCTGRTPEDNVKAFRAALENYDKDLTLEDAARELSIAPDDFKLALAYASTRQVKLGSRLAGLAHGRVVTRPYFESQFPTLYGVVQMWRQATQ